MSVLGVIKQDLAVVWADITSWASTDGKVAEAFFSAAITDVGSELKTEGLKIVSDAVNAAEAAGGTGEAKFAAAFAAASADLAADSITVAEHVLNVAIEAAVSQLNASKPAQDATMAIAQSSSDTTDEPPAADTSAQS